MAVVCVSRRAAAPARRVLQVVQQQHGQEAAHEHQAGHALWQAGAVVVRCAAAVVVVMIRLNLAVTVLVGVMRGLQRRRV